MAQSLLSITQRYVKCSLRLTYVCALWIRLVLISRELILFYSRDLVATLGYCHLAEYHTIHFTTCSLLFFFCRRLTACKLLPVKFGSRARFAFWFGNSLAWANARERALTHFIVFLGVFIHSVNNTINKCIKIKVKWHFYSYPNWTLKTHSDEKQTHRRICTYLAYHSNNAIKRRKY